MKKLRLLPYVLFIFVAFASWTPDSYAYERYNDGCQNCHGSFTGGTSTKGSTFPSDDKHSMHRSSSAMGTACDLCHSSGDNRDPFIGSSDGTSDTPGLGCVGCHGRSEDGGNDSVSAGLGAGLRQHHTNTGETSCSGCHRDADPKNYTPFGEQTFPPYYGTTDTNADEPCNPSKQAALNENWTVEVPQIGEGLDNDGDGLYDTADPNCQVNQTPISDPNGPYSGTVNTPVQFNGSGSNDPDGTIVSYSWDFGDGNIGAGVNTAHTYGSAGTYTVSLMVTDNDGGNDTATSTATITDIPQVQPPVSDPNGPYNGTVAVPVQFNGSGSNDPDGSIVAYEWDFGDSNTGMGVNPAYTYGSAGTYTVSLMVTDNDGLSDTTTSTATITDIPLAQPPVADPNGPYSGTVAVPVKFNGSASFDPDGTIVSYLWDFSDGSTETGVSPTHTYSSAGPYTVTLTVADNAGLSDTTTTTAMIEEQLEADVSVEKFQTPKNLKLGTRTASKIITAVSDADTKAQEATVELSWDVPPELVNIVVSPSSISSPVMPGKGGDRFNFNADISCIQPGEGTITWTVNIDATENREGSNDEATATTDVTCR